MILSSQKETGVGDLGIPFVWARTFVCPSPHHTYLGIYDVDSVYAYTKVFSFYVFLTIPNKEHQIHPGLNIITVDRINSFFLIKQGVFTSGRKKERNQWWSKKWNRDVSYQICLQFGGNKSSKYLGGENTRNLSWEEKEAKKGTKSICPPPPPPLRPYLRMNYF